MIGTILQANVAEIAQSVNAVWILIASFMVFLMQPGFALLEAGQVRAKNVANVVMKNIMDWSLGVLVYFVIGLGLAGVVGGLTSPGPLDPGEAFAYLGAPEAWITWLFGAVFAMAAATIVSGAVAGRITFLTYVLFAVVVAAVIYPVVQGMVWQGGLLSEAGYLGQLLGTGYLDFAGGTVVHMVGGLAGLVAAAIIGPRDGRFDEDGSTNPIPGHSVFLALLGTLVLAFGWYGFNVGTQATVLTEKGTFQGAALGRVALTTTLGMGAGTVGSALVTTAVRGRPDPLYTANGLLAGLVGVTSAAAYVTWWGAIIIGALAGALVMPTFRWVLEDLKVDDVCGVFAIHGSAGAIGALLIPVFAVGPNGAWTVMGADQFLMQVVGVAVIGTWTVLATIAAFRLIGLVTDLRVSADDERDGLDAAEHDITAYPEFNVIRESADDGTPAADEPERTEESGRAPSGGGTTADSEVMWRGQSFGGEDGPVTIARDALVTSLAKPAFVFDEDGSVVHANEPAESRFGARTDGGTAATDAVETLADLPSDLRRELRTVIENGDELDGYRTAYSRDGERREVELTATPIRRDGREAVLVIVEDVTERVAQRQKNEDLIAYRDRAIETHREHLERLAEGELDIETGITEPTADSETVIEAHEEMAALEATLSTVVENVHAIVERLPDQSADLADRSESLNDLSDEVRAVTDQTDELTAGITTEVRTLSEEADDVAAIVEDQTAAIEQISASTSEISNQSAAATELTEQAVGEVTDVVAAIREATEVSETVTADIESLDERMADVEDIVTMIDGIAEQTNILALNASIEAAQADANGDGFAVVADEVKALAEETREQADEIASILAELQAETGDVVDSIRTANEQVATGADQLTSVVDSLETAQERVSETNDGIAEISDAADRQARDAAEVSDAIEEVSRRAKRINESIDDISENVTRQTEAVATVSETADELELLAADMDESVGAFSADVRREIGAAD